VKSIEARDARRVLVVWIAFVCLIGCAASNDGDVLDPSKDGLEGTWDYLVTNAYEARFTDCTGDATVLEGATLYEGLSLAPICLAAVSFAADQNGDGFDVPPHAVSCSDGSSGTASGSGRISGFDVEGQWDSLSGLGVEAVQLFSGSISGNTIEITETHRSFDGTFRGECRFSPALTALITVH
jgi:hypothetical protein